MGCGSSVPVLSIKVPDQSVRQKLALTAEGDGNGDHLRGTPSYGSTPAYGDEDPSKLSHTSLPVVEGSPTVRDSQLQQEISNHELDSGGSDTVANSITSLGGSTTGGGGAGLNSQTSSFTRPAGTAECTRTSAVFTTADAVTLLPNLADCSSLVNANTLQTPRHSVTSSAPKQSHALLFQAHSLSDSYYIQQLQYRLGFIDEITAEMVTLQHLGALQS